MNKHFLIIAFICSIAFTGVSENTLKEEDRKLAAEVRRICNMAGYAVWKKDYNAALAQLVSPSEMKQLNATHTIQEIVRIVSERGASRIKRFLEYGKYVYPKISADKSKAVYSDKSISFTFFKSDDTWYVKDFDKTFYITKKPVGLPTDEEVLKEVNAYFDKAIEHITHERDKEAMTLLAPPDKLQRELKKNEEAVVKNFREKKAKRLLETLTKAKAQKPKDIAWDKEWLHYRFDNDDLHVYRQGGKWCVGK
jgi:hypothetical protein